jgi:hypothetical protein
MSTVRWNSYICITVSVIIKNHYEYQTQYKIASTYTVLFELNGGIAVEHSLDKIAKDDTVSSVENAS